MLLCPNLEQATQPVTAGCDLVSTMKGDGMGKGLIISQGQTHPLNFWECFTEKHYC